MSITDVDLTTVGLSAHAKQILDQLVENEYFAAKLDAYRFAIALALSRGGIAAEVTKGGTIFNVGSLDPDGHLRNAVDLLRPSKQPYRTIEKLAEWGVTELGLLADDDNLRISDLLAVEESRES